MTEKTDTWSCATTTNTFIYISNLNNEVKLSFGKDQEAEIRTQFQAFTAYLNIIKPLALGVEKECIGNEWVNFQTFNGRFVSVLTFTNEKETQAQIKNKK